MTNNEIIFKTKRDRNGNRYYLIVNFEAKTIERGYNLRINPDGTEVTKKGLHDLTDKFFEMGFGLTYK